MFNTFLFMVYDVKHMVKDHTDNEWQSAAATSLATLSNWLREYFIGIIPQTG